MKTREEKMIDDDKALSSHTRKGRRKKQLSSPKEFQKGNK
jgi:hypothetical protein